MERRRPKPEWVASPLLSRLVALRSRVPEIVAEPDSRVPVTMRLPFRETVPDSSRIRRPDRRLMAPVPVG